MVTTRPAKRWIRLGALAGLIFIVTGCAAVAETAMASPVAPAAPRQISSGSEMPATASVQSESELPVAQTESPVAEMPAAPQAPVIGNVVILSPALAPFEKFEAQFDVTTVAAYKDLPFDPAPPPGLPAGAGVSVDVLFSPDNWTTVITQPAFLYQPYTAMVRSNRDHFTPSGKPRWAVRFAPQRAGNWQLRIRARDAGGTTLHPASGGIAFTVNGTSANAYVRRGFLRVSQADRRYFEFQDGTPFVGVGYNGGFASNAGLAEQRMALYESYGMSFFRLWLSMLGINGSEWSSWGWPNQPWDGYLPATNLEIFNTFQGADVSYRLANVMRCYFSDYWQNGIPVEPNTTYSLTARIKADGVAGPASSGQPYGFVVKRGNWPDATCSGGTRITPYTTGTTGWITITGGYTTGGTERWLDYLYLAMENTTGGYTYIDDVRVWRASDPNRINLLREPNANSHLYFDPMNAARADLQFDSAQRHGVYLKLVLDEKSEWIRNRILPNGHMTNTASGNNRFYAAPGTKGRWLHEAWWRYVIARWGYSTAIHSFEFLNEGDPFSGNHYNIADAMARYFHQNDPSRHMVTTSFWHSLPNREFWQNAAYPDVDYADLHAYISTGWGNDATFLNPSRLETLAQHVRTGNGSARLAGTDNDREPITPRGLVISEPGEWIVRYWMKAQNFTANCSAGSTGGMQRVRWGITGGAEGVVPPNAQGNTSVCASPAGTFGWTQFRSDRDRNGQIVPQQYRLILADNQPREINLWLENSNGTGGTAWFDDIELVSPSGRVVPVIGQFETALFDEDTAWYNRAYGDLYGAKSPAGVAQPLVRGETGMDTLAQQEWQRSVNSDTQGIWLHNNVWGQINAGGMYDLMWWSAETIDRYSGNDFNQLRARHIYTPFLTYRNFMAGIPLDNGNYRDLGATTSRPALRAWGQRDDVNGRMHVWVQNRQHTWKRVVFGPAVPSINGSISIPGVPSGAYTVTWWNTYNVANPIFLTQIVNANGSLTLNLPAALQKDVAVKLERRAQLPVGVAPRAYVPALVRH